MRDSAKVIDYQAATYLKIGREHVCACPCGEGVDRWSYVVMKNRANHYKTMHDKSQKRTENLKIALAQARGINRQERGLREKELLQELEKAKAEIVLLKKKLYGKSSEVTSASEKVSSSSSRNKKRPRGQQRGTKGHGRRQQPDLKVHEEYSELPILEQRCKACQLPLKEIASTEDSEVIEIEVNAHIRKIRRKKYLRHSRCRCSQTKAITTASAKPTIFKRCRLGISVWVMILLNKYEKQ